MTDTLYLCGEIDTKLITKSIGYIINANLAQNKPKEFKLIINSDGGDFTEAFALIDVIRGSKIPIHGYGIGKVNSAAFYILISCHKRFVTKNTSIMCHKPTWNNGDMKFDDIDQYTKEFSNIETRIFNLFYEQTDLSKKDITENLLTNKDIYLYPEEALDYNLVDEVTENLNIYEKGETNEE